MVAVFGISRDITDIKNKERERAKEKEVRYAVIFESSADAIMTLSPPDWKFTSGNPAAIRMFGVKDGAEFKTLGPWNVSPKNQPNGELSSQGAKKMIKMAMETGSSFFEWTHCRLNGDDFPATVLLSRIKLEGRDLLQATVRDITKEKKIEQELQSKVQELEKANESMVGRELKMVQLKKEILELKSKLNKLTK